MLAVASLAEYMGTEVDEISELPQLQKLAPAILEKLASLDLPSHEEIVKYLSTVSWPASLMLIVVGVVYLAYGWKIFKVLVIVNAGFVGVIAGAHFGGMYAGAYGGQHMPIIGAAAGGVLLAALAWPLMKYSVSIMGGLAGSFLGYGLWHYVTTILDKSTLNKHAWVGALIGLLVIGLLAFIIFRVTVIIFTCIQGAAMTVAGLLAIALKYEPTSKDLQDQLVNNPHLLPLLVALPALVGLAFQHTASAQKDKKKRILQE